MCPFPLLVLCLDFRLITKASPRGWTRRPPSSDLVSCSLHFNYHRKHGLNWELKKTLSRHQHGCTYVRSDLASSVSFSDFDLNLRLGLKWCLLTLWLWWLKRALAGMDAAMERQHCSFLFGVSHPHVPWIRLLDIASKILQLWPVHMSYCCEQYRCRRWHGTCSKSSGQQRWFLGCIA